MFSKTLEQEERIQAREEEHKCISAKMGSDVRMVDIDPRTTLSQEELAAVNTQARRISDRVDGGRLQEVIVKPLAEKMQDGTNGMIFILCCS